MRSLCLLLHGISLLGLSGHIFPNELSVIVGSVITANVKPFLPFFDHFKLSLKDFDFKNWNSSIKLTTAFDRRH